MIVKNSFFTVKYELLTWLLFLTMFYSVGIVKNTRSNVFILVVMTFVANFSYTDVYINLNILSEDGLRYKNWLI